MAAQTDTPIEIRRSESADRAAVLELLSASLGWLPDDQFDDFFDWKHEQNPFGRSPGWVAVADDAIVGFRTLLRWEYQRTGSGVSRAVRAVDTATHPDFQGHGIFRRLTLHAIDDLAADGVDFIFNTPNEKSRPGYLKMGWTEVGTLTTSVRLTSPASVVPMIRSRVPADRWSTSTEVGRPAPEVLADAKLADLLAAIGPTDRLRTRRTPEFLRWRYGFPALAYRAVTLSDDVTEGVALFRLRRRGPALECALCDVVVPDDGAAMATRSLVRSVIRSSGADYVIKLGGPPIDRLGFVRLPGQGPTLTWRPLQGSVEGGASDHWALSLGDIELF